MKNLFLFLSLAGLLSSCGVEDISTPAPSASCIIEGVYFSPEGKISDFGADYVWLDMTTSNEADAATYNNSYYAPFSSPYLANYTVTEQGITFDLYDIHTKTILHFIITKINCNTINISFSNGLETFERGFFTKQNQL